MATETNTTGASSTLVEQLIAQAPDALIHADSTGTIRVWNEGATRLFGYSSAESLGRNLDLIIPERYRAAHHNGFAKAMQSGITKYSGRLLTTRAAHKDGRKLYVELGFAMIRDESGAVIGSLAVARDCTERHLTARASAPSRQE